MKLSELPENLGIRVVKDAEFHNLGFLFDELPDKLVFLEAPRFLAAARRSKGICCMLCSC